MNTKKIIKYIFIAIPLLFLAKWGIETIVYNSNKIPEVNPHPTQKVRIYGKFPLDPNKYYIKVIVDYIAINPKCDNVNWFEGARFSAIKYQEINATILDNNYELAIFSDYYKTGFCVWKMREIDLDIIEQNRINDLSYHVSFSGTKRGLSIYDNSRVLTQAKSPLNFICNYDYHASSDYTHYFCEDKIQNIISDDHNIVIFLPDSQREFEVNFQQMAEPKKQTIQGEK